MKKRISKVISLTVIIAMLSACGSMQVPDITDAAETNTNNLNEKVEESVVISLEGNSASSDSDYVLIDEDSIEITGIGSYKLVGDYNGQIRIDTEEKGQVQLILAGVNLTNNSDAPIYIEQADEPVITVLQDTNNKIEDTSVYLEEEAEDLGIERTNGAIYSKADLVINGTGDLTITTSDKTAILSKDDLIVYDVILSIVAGRNGIKGNDLVHISGATLDIQAKQKGIQSDILVDIKSGTIQVNSIDDSIHSNDTVMIQSGNITLTTEDDGVHADQILQIDSGVILIEDSYEGLEAKDIIINDGEVTINASDDGVNATDGSTETLGRGDMMEGKTYDFGLHINGGILSINSYGDGLDSNGNVWMTGGKLIISGPINNGNGSLDYNGTFEMTGGDLVAVGSSGMLQTPSQVSTINTMVIGFDSAMNAGVKIRITNETEETLVELLPEKAFESLIYSSIDLQVGKSYNVYINDELYTSIELTDTITTFGTTGGIGSGPQNGRQKGERPSWIEGEIPLHPNGEDPLELPQE